MPGKKSLTIGITVNLENYENLRLEVTGEVADQQEVKDLVGFLDQTLTNFGRGNPATIALIEKYRARVLSTGDGSASTLEPALYSQEPEPEWPEMEVPAPLPVQQPLTPPAEAAPAPTPTPATEPAVPAKETTRSKTFPAQKPEKPKKEEKPAPAIQPEPTPVAPTPTQAPRRRRLLRHRWLRPRLHHRLHHPGPVVRSAAARSAPLNRRCRSSS